MSVTRTRFSLQSLLTIDAVTCAAMGLLLVLAAGPVASLTGIAEPLLFWAGVLLLPAAGFMAAFGRAASVPAWAAHIVVAGNALWVLGSLLLPALGLIAPNMLGWAFLLSQAAVVALLAGLERAAARHKAVPA